MEYRGLNLDPFQEQSIRALEAGDSVLVCAPTGTGKTIIADWIVEAALTSNRRVIYTAPIKALSNQKFRDYRRLYGEDRVGLVTGDLVIRRDAPCLVMTTEILRNMLLAGEPTDDLLAVVLDEVHFLDDRERGTVWEEVLIYLPPEVQIVGLSATLSNVVDFAQWLEHVRHRPVAVIEASQRAVPLHFHYMSRDTGLVDPARFDRMYGRHRRRGRSERGRRDRRSGRDRRGRRSGRDRRNRTSHLDVFRAMREQDLLPYLFFVFSRRDTEMLARSLSRSLRRSLLSADEQARCDLRLAEAEIEMGHPIDDALREMYRKGVAFHHAGLHVGLKAVVEGLYEAKLLRVLYCTSTFALGINMPARSVVFDGLKKYDGRGVNPLTIRQFMQKAGRAGRRGMDNVGHVVVRMDYGDYEEYKPLLEGYRKGAPEPIRSSFNLSFNSIVQLLDQHEDHERIRNILDRSFLAWHLDRKADQDDQRAAALQGKRDRHAQKLASRAARHRSRVWDDFRAKVTFLQRIGYLDEALDFNAGARILRHLQIAEIFVTELILDGALEDLADARLFGVLCGITNSLPRHARPVFRIRREDRALANHIGRLHEGWAVTEGADLSGSPVEWDPAVMHLGRCWAEGNTLIQIVEQVQCDTDISGDLITGFRRAKDLAGQLIDVYADLPERQHMLKDLVKEVSRDEVEVVG